MLSSPGPVVAAGKADGGLFAVNETAACVRGEEL